MKIEILIIDDSLEIGESLQLIINNLGFVSKYFNSAEKGMTYFQTELNPIIFLDISLPNQNGLELLPTIKKISPYTQVIMMTGENGVENVVSSLKNKAFDFLFKPFSLESVQITIEKAVDYYNLLRENFNYQENLERDMKFISSIQKQIISPRKNSDSVYADFNALSFVSGSFYYTEEIEEKTIMIFGDIEGNSVTSSFIGLLAICILKDIIKKETDPGSVLSKLNDELYFKINIHSLTAICLLIDKTGKQIHYSNGGNTEPILINRNSKEISYLDSSISNIIGIMPNVEFNTKSIELPSDSILFLYNPEFMPAEHNSKKGIEAFILEIQNIYKTNDSFEKIKEFIDNFISNNSKIYSKKNFSFYLQKF